MLTLTHEMLDPESVMDPQPLQMPASPNVNHSTESLERTQTRFRWNDGGFSDITSLRFPPDGFALVSIDQHDRSVKLKEAAHLRYVKALARGEHTPHIVAFSRLEEDRPTSETFPGMDWHTDSGEELFSANSFITDTLRTLLARGHLRYEQGTWRSAVPPQEPAWRERAQAVLLLLTQEGRLLLDAGPGRPLPERLDFAAFSVQENLVPVDRLGFAREFVWREQPRLAFNTSFFLLEHDDYLSHHSALGEPYNLLVQDGTVCRPPLYRRGTLYQRENGHWHAGHFSLADISMTLPDGTRFVPQGCDVPGLPFALNAPGLAAVTVYTRAFGIATHGHPLGHTPEIPKQIEYTIVDSRIVGRKAGGGLEIPQNGLVLSWKQETRFLGKNLVSYHFVREEHQRIVQAIQVGPLLLQNGHLVLSPDSLTAEEFWPTPLGESRAPVGIVPTDYPDDVDHTRAGRVGLGVDREGYLIVIAVPGTERGMHIPDVDSHGATLAELADLLAQAGAVDAINLDGGGSTQLFYLGGLTTPAGGRYGMPGVHFERMIPDIGALW
ncbi:MAG: phosphodiester glycosidase family protein [Chloroflexota bacterium]|nr:phosphodiester glycosidase family protein [Chloroflexota bacterium]